MERLRRCQECLHPLEMEWVAVGRCGHRNICSECSLTDRCRRKLTCPSCGAHCPTVLITRATEMTGDSAVLRWTRPAASREGRVGKYWKTKHTSSPANRTAPILYV
ncbi:hypothetical protein TRIUR3_14467 [Triticum urartu]|uniref:Uncharacterized protein n=1 Tax=Triticum urartu TaxID=4572 RepID=M7ZUC4_TRIUA|nr:hypothetical protein TRIUR3_14467 [Triticum urartu]